MTSKQMPIPFSINATNTLYYNMKNLQEYKPEYFYGFQRYNRQIIERKNIPESDYVYASYNKKCGWTIFDNTSKKALLLISKTWVDRFYFGYNTINSPEISTNNSIIFDEEECDEETETEEEIVIGNPSKVEQKVVMAPNILHLDDSEKFTDIDGSILEIETRGLKEQDGIYFKVNDVAIAFGLENLHIVLIGKNANYIYNEDYKYFFISTNTNIVCNAAIKRELYLTYDGIVRVLFLSKNKNVKGFQKWAFKTLFTCQMGSNEKRIELVAEVMNTDAENVSSMFNKFLTTQPCIYLLSLGLVKNLRDTFNISPEVDGNLMVYKFGRTNDFKTRLENHINNYGKMKNVDIKVIHLITIDVKFLAVAESEVKSIFNDFDKTLRIDKHDELVAFGSKLKTQIKTLYEKIGRCYVGSCAELQTKIDSLIAKIELNETKHELEILKLKTEVKDTQYKYDMLVNKTEFENYKRENPMRSV